METNWNTFYTNHLNEVYASVPVPDDYMNIVGVAYWQWADGYMTDKRSFPEEPSVTKVVNTVTGYPEISYFISDCLLSFDNCAVSQDNINAMTGVKFYNDT